VECETDEDCPLEARHCVHGACAACAPASLDPPADAGAPAGGCTDALPACYPGDQSCHERCGADPACPPSAQHCDVASGACWRCAIDAEWRSGACAPWSHQCVECTADEQCAGRAKQRCDVLHGVCVACSSNDDCGRSAPICDPATRECRVGCSGDAQCPGE